MAEDYSQWHAFVNVVMKHEIDSLNASVFFDEMSKNHMGLKVLTAQQLTMFLWVKTPYRLVGRFPPFGKTRCRLLQGRIPYFQGRRCTMDLVNV